MSKTLFEAPKPEKLEKELKQNSNDPREKTPTPKFVEEVASKEAQNKPKVNNPKADKSNLESERKLLENKPNAKLDANEIDASKKIENKLKELEVDINESAEAFINKFKQELIIQRAESIENYKKMLAKGL